MDYGKLLKLLNSHFKRIRFELRYHRHTHTWHLIKIIGKTELISAMFASQDKAIIQIAIMEWTLSEKEYDNQLPFSSTAKSVNMEETGHISPEILELLMPKIRTKKPENMPHDRPTPKPRNPIDLKYPYNS